MTKEDEKELIELSRDIAESINAEQHCDEAILFLTLMDHLKKKKREWEFEYYKTFKNEL